MTMIENVFSNQRAEMAVIGAAIQDGDAAKKIALLDNGLFVGIETAAIHRAIKRLVADGKNVDIVNLFPELDKEDNKPINIDTAFVVECINVIPGVSLYTEYVKILIECNGRRKLNLFAEEMRKRCSDPVAEVNEVRQWALRELKEIRIEVKSNLQTLAEALVSTYCQIEADHATDEEGNDGRIYSGIKTLDERLGGLKGGLYMAIGARPGVGKSILALTYCINAAINGKRVLMVSLEMDTVQITQRVMAAYSNVSLKAITGGEQLTQQDWDDLGMAMSNLGSVEMWYSTEADTIDKVRAAAYQLYEDGGIDLIAIDYLQLMEATYSKRQNRQEQISEVSRGLRKLAQELNIPILVLTQLNRESTHDRINGIKREPTMADARESGAIEQDANIFMLLHEPVIEEMKSEHAKMVFERAKQKGIKIIRLIVDKNRQGKQCRMDVAFDGAHMRYLDLNGQTEI